MPFKCPISAILIINNTYKTLNFFNTVMLMEASVDCLTSQINQLNTINPISTLYWGMPIELGVTPLKYIINYKRLMVYHNLIHSSDKRITKQIVDQQKKYKIAKCF